MAQRWRAAARRLEREVFALSLACRDPRVPAHAKILAAGVVAYAFSPIDLIPDFIPILGHLDDLVLLPPGVLMVRRLIPRDVLTDCRARAESTLRAGRPAWWSGAIVVVASWIVLAAASLLLIRRWLRPSP